MDLKGKKLLILGAYSTEIEIINEARKLGVYTIVTDNHTDWSLAPAKSIADEAYDLSWSDYDALEKLCREKNIDGCLSGFSEIRIKCLKELCKRMGFHFYGEGADIETICNKDKFRDACIACGIAVPDTYRSPEEIKKYPVIVKPVDNAGARGIKLVHREEDLAEALTGAQKNAYCGDAVIDEYMEGDDPRYEPAFFYTIHNGTATLNNSLDRIMVNLSDDAIKQAVADIYPSRYLDTFIEKEDAKFRKLFADLGMKNGIVFLQGKMKNGKYAPVDIGYRLEGSLSFHFSDFINGTNGMQMMIRYALTGTMGDDEVINTKDTPRYDKTGVIIVLLATKGKIAHISGIDEIKKEKCVLHLIQKMDVGTECTKTVDFSQIFSRIYLCSDNKQELRDTIDRIYSTVKVLDEDGNNMLIGRYDADELK